MFNKLFKNPISYFFIISSIFITVLLLDYVHFFSWVKELFNTIKPIWLGTILAFFIQPLLTKNTLSRIILVYVLFLLLFLFFFIVVFYLLIENMSIFIEMIESIYPKLEKLMIQYKLNELFQTKEIVMGSYTWIYPILQGFFSFITTFVFSVIISFFISLESNFIKNEFKKYVKQHDQILKFYDIFSDILRQYIYSTFLDIVYIVITTFFILYFLKTPYAFLLSILLAVFNLFPYIGALAGSLLVVVIHFLLIKENTILLIFLIIINSQIESNIIHAWICNKTMKIHPLFLFIALFINEFLFGIIGIILSPIVASILQMIFNTYREYLNQKNIGGWEDIVT